jgi:hypothetical protein
MKMKTIRMTIIIIVVVIIIIIIIPTLCGPDSERASLNNTLFIY